MITLPITFPVTAHTDFVGPRSTFIAIKGERCDGLDFVPLALQKGATTIVVDKKARLPDEVVSSDVKVHRVTNTRRALAVLSALALDYPAHKLKILGITGTKGKTTTVFVLEHMLRSLGYKTALLSTVHNKILDQTFPTKLTTQQPDYLQVFFDACVQAGVEYVVMEVAAQALTLHRVTGITFAGALFTNFSQEHAEFYDSLEDYFKAKCQLFGQVALRAPVVINTDDPWLQKIKTAGMASFGSEQVKQLSTLCGAHFIMGDLEVYCPTLFGAFNALNIAGALTLVRELGISLPDAAATLTSLAPIPGRLSRYPLPNGATCFIDYAHNPASFEAVLSALRGLTDQLIVVFGAAGDRDTTKRPLMGAVAARYADVVVLTSDNPRSEDPAAIMVAVCDGISNEQMHKVIRELDREQAIKKAYELSRAASIIAVLGKGPDEYQEVQGVKHFFSDAQVVTSL